VARLERAWASELRRVEVTVEDVPTADPASWEGGMVPLARTFGRHGGQPTRITLYRRPIESRAPDPGDLAILVLDVLVEQVAHILGRRPDEIDPGYEH
jgi:predicted Zn-dependent protease with MMP-like domain